MIFAQIENAVSSLRKPAIIGISGVDTAGKTTFARKLAGHFSRAGVNAAVIHADDFHNPPEVRHADLSPEGYIKLAFDLPKLAGVLRELKHPKENCAPVVIAEGVMIFRPPLDEFFDYRIFLDVSFDEVLRRARERDVPLYGEEFLQKYIDRYIPAQKIFLREYAPKTRCDLVISNNDFRAPTIGELKCESMK